MAARARQTKRRKVGRVKAGESESNRQRAGWGTAWRMRSSLRRARRLVRLASAAFAVEASNTAVLATVGRGLSAFAARAGAATRGGGYNGHGVLLVLEHGP